MKFSSCFFAFFILAQFLVFCSCSNNRTTVTRETRSVGSEGSERVGVTKTEENIDSKNNSCAGVLSCTVDFLGDVIAFPFRLVGGLVQAIF